MFRRLRLLLTKWISNECLCYFVFGLIATCILLELQLHTNLLWCTVLSESVFYAIKAFLITRLWVHYSAQLVQKAWPKRKKLLCLAAKKACAGDSSQDQKSMSRSTVWRQKQKKDNQQIYEDLKAKDRERKKKDYYIEQLDETREGRYKRREKRKKKSAQQKQRCKRNKAISLAQPKNKKQKNTARNEYLWKDTWETEEPIRPDRESKPTNPKIESANNLEPIGASTPVKNNTGQGKHRSSRYRKQQKIQKNLPNDSVNYAEIIESLVDTCTPRKQEELKKGHRYQER